MADSNLVEKPLLEKLQNLLERKPGTYDVAFCVGKEKTVVRALKVILKASSSPFLEKEFEEKWEVAVVKEGDGIPLPDFDPIALKLFVKLTSLDTWSPETLETLPLHQILNLLTICRRFEMTKAVENLSKLATSFLKFFGEYKETDDFLQLSQTNLKSILGSDDIEIKELKLIIILIDIFHAALRWADFQCKQMKVEPTEENFREVLGDCLFEIRFPIMTCAEFTKARGSKDVLTAEESLEIYGFIGLEASKTLKLETKKLPFKTTQRNREQALEPKGNSEAKNSGALILPGIFTLCLTQGLEIVENPLFVCDGSQKSQIFACAQKTRVYGLGFLGPIENGGFYDVKVQITGQYGITYDSGMLKKRIFAEKGKMFFFIFDAPIDLEAGNMSGRWTTFYRIDYYLKGSNTSACCRALYNDVILQVGDAKLRLQWCSNQLVEVLFKLN